VVQTPVLGIELDEDGPSDGRPVLLLHGWPDAPRGWKPVREQLHGSGWRTIVPALRGSGATRFRSPDTPRDGRGVALAADALDLLDALELDHVHVVGHDWGARAAYTMAVLAPERVHSIATLALAYQPHAEFSVPEFGQARLHWYQWLMHVDAGAHAVAADPIGFARIQWETWSPPGWFDEAEFRETARSFANPDWVAITLNAYRTRFLPQEPIDPRYEPLARRLAEVEQIAVPTLMIQGASDRCDPPASSADLDQHFIAGYRRELLEGVGHFPHREAATKVAELIDEHFAATSAGDR
jgi:pimeloyl-ACP methyl ester carboxylesterase